MVNSVFGVTGTSIFESMSRLASEVQSINLGQGFPENGLEPPELIEAAVRAVREGAHQYPPMMGLPVLRQAVATNSKRWLGLDVDWEREVLVTSGATEALADAFLALLEPGDEIILLEPAYDSYPTIIRRAGATPVQVRLDPPDWALQLDRLEAAITPRTRAIVINTPMNPISKVFSREELRGVADLLLKYDLIAICDEVYEHLIFDGRRHETLFSFPDIRDRVVRIGSAGKTFSVTGWKVGYVTADAKLLGPIAKAHQFVTFTTPPALQAAVAYGLNLPDGYFEGLRSDMARRRALLVDGLRDAGFLVGDVAATYFAVVATDDLPDSGDDFALCRRITREAKVTAIPISAFYDARNVHSHIRFCFAKSTHTLQKAVQQLARWRGELRWKAAS
jgi:aspartate/methionine/tyrosine aminotransferase